MKLKDKFKLNENVLVFDGNAWQKTGDIGDNSQFYKEAKIIRIRYHKPVLYGSAGWVADIEWKKTKSISYGHFITGIKHIE